MFNKYFDSFIVSVVPFDEFIDVIELCNDLRYWINF